MLIAPRTPLREVLLVAAPSCFVAAICLSFFLSKAFTIDDPIFLRAAQQSFITPTHPFSYDMCWEADGIVRHFSTFVANAPLMGYFLMPIVHSGAPEVAGHALQIILLMSAILATASIALRLGLSRREAILATSLTATCPAVLAMSSTVMPDILALAMATISFERFLAWRQGGGFLSAIAAILALALGPLARPQLIAMLPTCALLCFPALSVGAVRRELRTLRPSIALIVTAWALYFAVASITHDAKANAVVIRSGLMEFAPVILLYKILSLGSYLLLTTPFAIGVLIFLVRGLHYRIMLIAITIVSAIAAIALRDNRLYLIALAAPAYFALIWVLFQALKIGTGVAAALALWALIPFPIVIYLHVAPKYLVPSAPAYALLLVILAGKFKVRNASWLALCGAGLVLSILILSADARFANQARLAAIKWSSQTRADGQRVIYLGQWGFQWYAERYGAACFSPNFGLPRTGDSVIVDSVGGRPFPVDQYPTARLAEVISTASAGGVVMDRERRVGFYSSFFGYLPWAWAPAGTTRFERWEIR